MFVSHLNDCTKRLATKSCVPTANYGLPELISVMLVSAQLQFRQSLQALLNLYNLNKSLGEFQIVGEADSPIQTISLAKKHQPTLIVLDIDFFHIEGDGIHTLAELSHLLYKGQQKCKVLVLSDRNEDKFIFCAMQAGACGYILKKNLTSQFHNALTATNSGQIYLCPEVATHFFRMFHFYGSCFSEPESRQLAVPELQGSNPYHLTQREREVLQLLVQGYSNQEIGRHLYISVATVKAHLTAIFEKLGVKSRSSAIVTSLKLGIV